MKKKLIIIFCLFLCIHAEAQHNEYVEILSDYIQYPSVQGAEKEAGQYFLGLSRQHGFETKVLTDNDSAYNFVASLYPISSGKPNYVFLNHIDVVDPGDTTKWKYPPFSGAIAEGSIWGRGAIDNKGMAVAQWAAILQFMQKYKKEDLPFNVSLLAVSGEESGSIGARDIIENWLEELNIEFILGEGGSGVQNVLTSDPEFPFFGVSTSEKTRLVINLLLEYKSSGHSSVPPDNYALKGMIKALEKLINKKKELEFTDVNIKSLKQIGKVETGIRGFVLRHHRFLLFRPLVASQIKKDPMIASFFSNTIAITDIKIPVTDDNQFPIKVSATLDCRLLPETDVDDFIKGIKRRIDNKRIDIIMKHEVLSPGRTFDPVYFDMLDASIKGVYPKSETIEIIFPATSDNSLFRNKGLTVFGLYPGIFTEDELGHVHSTNEHMPISAFTQAISVYYNFLQKIMIHNSDKQKLSIVNSGQ